MFIRLLFWTAEKPNPRVIATGTGRTLEGAMDGCFAPVYDKSWTKEYKDGKLYLRRGLVGYCGEVLNSEESPKATLPVALSKRHREILSVVSPRPRAKLD